MFLQFVIVIVVTVTAFYQLEQMPGFAFGLLILLLLLAGLSLIWWLNSVYSIKQANQSCAVARFKKICSQKIAQQTINILIAFIIGLNLVFWQAFFSAKLPTDIFNKSVKVQGQVVDLVELQQTAHFYKLKFQFEIDSIEADKQQYQWSWQKPKIIVSWYLKEHQYQSLQNVPKSAQQWQLQLKIKPNHATMNLGGRDYEGWLYQQHIDARAYLSGLNNAKTGSANSVLLYQPENWHWQNWRLAIANQLDALFVDSELSGIYRALLIGDKSAITDTQWQTLRDTGTIHLMAISGLHMAIVAAIGYGLFRLLWSAGLYRLKHFNRPMLAAFGGVLLASGYLLISGAAIPTQRAWIMVVTVLGFLMLQRKFRPWSALAMAALLVLLWDSRAVLSQGFWLSFSAVIWIFISLQLLQNRSRWLQLIVIQLLLTVGLAPFIIWYFYQIPVYSFIANLIAVPVVSFIGLPLLFIEMLLAWVWADLAKILLSVTDFIWQQLWLYLNWLQNLPKIQFITLQHSVIWLILALTALLLWSVFWLKKARQKTLTNLDLTLFSLILIVYLAVLQLLPYKIEKPLGMEVVAKQKSATPEFWLTVLDVGQGQSIVIETANHVVVYDTGGKFGQTTDAAKIALLPYLKSRNINRLDLLIVSHSDNDHAGGSRSLLTEVKAKQLVSGQADRLNSKLAKILTVNNRFEFCKQDLSWQFDAVNFEILAPLDNGSYRTLQSDNDRSCVLKISNAHRSVIITGDLSQKGEQLLIEHYSENTLDSDLLIAGHHGSRSSSSANWLVATSPNKIVFSSGYQNRFKFPAQQTLERINDYDLDNRLQWWNTACSGAVSFKFSQQIKLRYQARKLLRKWYHHSCLLSEQGIYFQ